MRGIIFCKEQNNCGYDADDDDDDDNNKVGRKNLKLERNGHAL